MAAARNSLSSDLECAICSEQLEQPKYIGSCNHTYHTYCKCCIDKLWVSHWSRRTVPCPHCRKDCPIPSNGVSGLKDNFMIANIIETYRNQQQVPGDLTEIKCACTLCRNGASCLCKDCDLKLCPNCKRQHDRDPKKRDHDLFTLCPSHGNRLLFFCHPCKQALCGVCKVSDHDKGDHDVTPIRHVIDNLVSRIRATSTELEGVIRTQIGGKEKQLLRLCDIIEKKVSSEEAKATTGAKKTIDEKMKYIHDHQAKSREIQKQIDFLVKEKEKEDERTKLLFKDVDKLEKEKAKIIADIREKFTKPSEEINLLLQSLDTRRKEMTTKLEQGRAVGSTTITDTKSIAYLTSLSQGIMDFVNASRESDTRTVIEDVTRSISELGLDIGDKGQGLAVMSGDHQIRIGITKRVFRQLKKVDNVAFPRDQPCKEVCRLKHLHLPGSRLATLGWSHDARDIWAKTIYFHDAVSSSFTGRITDGVQRTFDIAVLSTGEVVVARNAKPPLRVFNPATGAYRDINITHDGKVIDRLWCVETDESDNMFVLISIYNALLLVVKPNGNVIQSVQLRGYAHSVAFSSLNRILYIAAGDRILRFHWSNNILKEISSSSHGVARFQCCDVCIGGGGEVLVAGLMGFGKIVIYQVEEGDVDENVAFRAIEYQDGVNRTCVNRLRICINDDNLWLGYENKFEKFKLV